MLRRTLAWKSPTLRAILFHATHSPHRPLFFPAGGAIAPKELAGTGVFSEAAELSKYFPPR